MLEVKDYGFFKRDNLRESQDAFLKVLEAESVLVKSTGRVHKMGDLNDLAGYTEFLEHVWALIANERLH